MAGDRSAPSTAPQTVSEQSTPWPLKSGVGGTSQFTSAIGETASHANGLAENKFGVGEPTCSGVQTLVVERRTPPFRPPSDRTGSSRPRPLSTKTTEFRNRGQHTVDVHYWEESVHCNSKKDAMDHLRINGIHKSEGTKIVPSEIKQWTANGQVLKTGDGRAVFLSPCDRKSCSEGTADRGRIQAYFRRSGVSGPTGTEMDNKDGPDGQHGLPVNPEGDIGLEKEKDSHSDDMQSRDFSELTIIEKTERAVGNESEPIKFGWTDDLELREHRKAMQGLMSV